LKRRILFSLLSLVLILSLVIIPTGCPKRDVATPTTDAERIAALESKVSQLQSKIASLPESDSTDYSGDINALYDDIGTLYDEIDNLGMELDDILAEVDEMLVAWEEEQINTNGNDGEVLTTGWRPTVEFSPPLNPDKYEVDVSWSPPRIKDEDTYRFTISIKNKSGEAISEKAPNTYLYVGFNPSSRYTSVDIYNTAIYAVTPLTIWWDDVEYNPSNGVDCKSIVFLSGAFDIPPLGWDGEEGETYTIKFNFDLYYAE